MKENEEASPDEIKARLGIPSVHGFNAMITLMIKNKEGPHEKLKEVQPSICQEMEPSTTMPWKQRWTHKYFNGTSRAGDLRWLAKRKVAWIQSLANSDKPPTLV